MPNPWMASVINDQKWSCASNSQCNQEHKTIQVYESNSQKRHGKKGQTQKII